MRMFKRLGAAIGVLAALANPAFANFNVTQGAGTAIFAVDSGNSTAPGTSGCASVECPAHVLINSAGAPIGVSGTPLYVTGSGGSFPVSGTFWQSTQPVSLASLPAYAATPTFNLGTAPTLTDNSTIVGPLGTATAPASAISFTVPDEVNACTGGNTCTATSAATLATVDMTGYASATVTLIANASANTITFTSSDDGTNYVPAQGYNISASTGGITYSTTVTAITGYQFIKKQRWLKVAVTTFVSGTTTVTIQLHQNSPVNVISNPALAAGTAAIGKTGPGFTTAQTPVTISATGTTAATTATLPAVAGKTTYLCGFSIRANATAAATGNATVTGTISGTLNFTQWTAPLASGLGVTEPNIGNICIPGSAVNTAINVISAAPGTGGVVSVSAWGYNE